MARVTLAASVNAVISSRTFAFSVYLGGCTCDADTQPEGVFTLEVQQEFLSDADVV